MQDECNVCPGGQHPPLTFVLYIQPFREAANRLQFLQNVWPSAASRHSVLNKERRKQGTAPTPHLRSSYLPAFLIPPAFRRHVTFRCVKDEPPQRYFAAATMGMRRPATYVA